MLCAARGQGQESGSARGANALLLAGAALFGAALAAAIPVGPFPGARGSARILAPALAALALAAGSLALLALLLRPRSDGPPRGGAPGARAPLLCAAGCALVGLAYLAAFYPGHMSYDSLNQWGQLTAFELNDHHPVTHTLLLWLLTRGWHSPAAVSLFQILLFAALGGAAVRFLLARGATPGIAAGYAIFYALFPLNAMYAVTLWKDVPYGAAVLLATMFLLEIVTSRGRWLEAARHRLWLAAVLVPVALLRHNGLLVAVAVMLGLLLAFRGYRRRLGAVALGVAALLLLVKFPLYDLLGVSRTRGVADTLRTYQLAAVVSAGAELTPPQRRVAEGILPLEDWKRYYTPFTVDYLTNSPRFDGRYFWKEENRAELARAWRELAGRYPGILLRHAIRNSSIVWRIRQFPDGYTMSLWFGIDPNGYGLETRPCLPWLHRFLEGLTRKLAADPGWNWFFCRPGLYLFVSLFACALLGLRLRDRRALLLLAPVLAAAAPFLLFSPCQDTRYLFPVMLAGPYLLAQALIRRSGTPGIAPGRDGPRFPR